MKQLNVLVLLIMLLSSKAFCQDKDEQAIRQLLSKQTTAWNAGNIEGFMHGYWQSDSLMFIGKSGLKYSYKTTLENYKKGYPDTAAMGKLNFDILQTKRLSADHFFVVGKWHLQRTIGNVEGFFTLLFKKIKQEWVIIADHSS